MVKVHILYCGGCGYEEKAKALQDKIKGKFPSVEIALEAAPQNNECFEVSVDGKLIHSKKNGDGYVDNDAKFDKIAKVLQSCCKI